jgi:uncharacterized coiled-coil DUF342 family protein
LTEKPETSDIATIDRQLDSLDRQAYETHEEIRRLIEKRDNLNDQFKRLRQEIHELKTERDNTNQKVHSLKSQRDETRATIRTIIEEIKAARKKIAEYKKKTPKRTHSDLQKELDDIEWQIQTTSLDLKEEKKLIDNVKQLETQLITYRKIEQQAKRISDLQQGLRALDETGEKLHTELSALAQTSQETHQKMLVKIDQAKKIKQEADALHQAYLQAREKGKPIDEERRRLSEERRKLQQSKQQQDSVARKTAEKALREKLESQAREKLQRGEKLSWDEFQLLTGEDESETQA